MGRKLLSPSPSRQRFCLGCALFTGILMLVVGVLVVFYVETLINAYINKMLAFTEDSPTFQSWKVPPVAIKTKLYFFNLTNPQEFLNGSKPIVNEVGPYVIGEDWERRNIVFYPNGTMSSQLYKTLRFLPEDSVGSDQDPITTINVPVASATNQGLWEDDTKRRTTSALLQVLGQSPVVTKTVGELIFGYPDSLVALAKAVMPPGQSLPYKDFGFFVGKNASLSPPLLLNTGVEDWRHIGRIERYEGSPTLPFWNSYRCNQVNGSDGAIYPPGATEDSIMYLFARDLCRSVELHYEKHVDHDGVDTLRFTPPVDIFDSPDTKPDNMCFCVDGPPCAPKGLFNISKCQYGSPTFMSFPHFYLADPALLDNVDGLSPVKEKHQFFIDLAPRVGVAMNAKVRLQINFKIGPVPLIESSTSLPDMYYPVLWMEAGMDGLPEDTVAMVKQAISAPAVARTSMTAVTFVLGVGLLLLALSVLLRRRWRRSKTDGATTEMAAAKNGVQTGPPTTGGGGGGAGKAVEMSDKRPDYVPYSNGVSQW